MKIRLHDTQSVRGTTVVLGDDASGEHIVHFNGGDETCLADIVPLPQAAEQWRETRDNILTDLTWRVDRQHADRDQALLFLLTHRRRIPNKCNIEIQHAGAVQWLCRAVKQSVRMVDYSGVHTVFEYRFTGGLFSNGPTS